MVTDRDRSVVAWIGVVGAVSAQDVMAKFRLGRTVGYRRLAALVELGLLTRTRLVCGQPALYTASREGFGVGRAVAGRPGTRGSHDDEALGLVRSLGGRPRAHGAVRGVG